MACSWVAHDTAAGYNIEADYICSHISTEGLKASLHQQQVPHHPAYFSQVRNHGLTMLTILTLGPHLEKSRNTSYKMLTLLCYKMQSRKHGQARDETMLLRLSKTNILQQRRDMIEKNSKTK
eukprot:scaffold100037_cov19-Tisochrysis_lutea.AAC.1